MRVRIENASSFGYDLTSEIWISENSGLLFQGPPDVLNLCKRKGFFAPLVPWKRMLRTKTPCGMNSFAFSLPAFSPVALFATSNKPSTWLPQGELAEQVSSRYTTWDTHPADERGVRSTLLTWEYKNSPRNHGKTMFMKMNQDMLGDLWRQQGSSGMIVGTTTRQKTWFQEVDVLKDFKIKSTSWQMLTMCRRIQNSKPEVDTVEIYVENHDALDREWFIWIRFDFWILDFLGYTPLAGWSLDFSNLCPGRESFAPCFKHWTEMQD